MTESNTCPDPEQLARWNAGSLPEEQFETLGNHLEQCTSCQNRLEQMDDQVSISFVHLNRISAADLERARLAIDADIPTVNSVANWLTELKNTRDSRFEPVLTLHCNLRQ